MTEEPFLTYESAIEEAFKDHEGDLVGFLRELLDVVKTGLPEQLLVTARNKLEKESDPIKAIWLRLLIADLHLIKRDLDSIPPVIGGILANGSLPKQLHAHVYYINARILMENAQIEETIESCEKALAMYDGDEDMTAVQHLNLLGLCSLQLNKKNSALKYFNIILGKMEKLGSGNTHSGIYNNIAITHMERGNVSEALAAYKKALEIEKKRRNPASIARAMSNISTLLLSQEKPEEALKYANTAFDVLQPVENNILRAFNFMNLAAVHFNLGNLDEALENIKQSLFFAESAQMKILLLEAKLLHGAILAKLKDSEAEDRLKEALDLYDKVAPGKPAENLEQALITYGKFLCRKMDPEGYDCLRKAERILDKRPQTPLVKTLLTDVRAIIRNLAWRPWREYYSEITVTLKLLT
jgi:tetratricopeptide (TPR) repeat protein